VIRLSALNALNGDPKVGKSRLTRLMACGGQVRSAAARDIDKPFLDAD